MLTSASSREELHSVIINSNDLHCPLTFQRYTEENYPITLPCGHTLSIQAFQKVKIRNRSCPFCRKPFPMNYAPQKNVLWWNVTQQVKTKHKIYCNKHPHDAAVAICLEEKVYICPDCLQEDDHLVDGVITLKKLGNHIQETRQKLDRNNEKTKSNSGTDKQKKEIDSTLHDRVEKLLQEISTLDSKDERSLTHRIDLIKELMEISKDLEPEELYENIGFPADSKKGLVGLDNVGQSGFMNAVFQCLSNTSDLTMSFLNTERLTDMDECAPLTNDSKLATAYGELMKNMWLGTSSDVSPSSLISTIKTLYTQFTGDAQEFLSFLLDALHHDLNSARGAPSFDSKDSNNSKPDNILAQESWDNHLRRNQSIVQELMHGQFLTHFECSDCQRVSATFDSYTLVSLPLPGHHNSDNPTVELAIYFVFDTSLKFPIKIDLEVPTKMTYQEILGKLAPLVHVPEQNIATVLIQDNNFNGFVDSSANAQYLYDRPAVLFAHEIPQEVFVDHHVSTSQTKYGNTLTVDKAPNQSMGNVEKKDSLFPSILAKILIHAERQSSNKPDELVSFPRIVKISPSESLKDFHLKVYKKMRRHLSKYFEAEKKKNPIDPKEESRKTRKEEYKAIFPENEQKLWPYHVYVVNKNSEKGEPFILQNDETKLNAFMRKMNLDANELTLKVVFPKTLNMKSLKLDRCLQYENKATHSNPESAPPKNTNIYDCFNILTRRHRLDSGQVWFCSYCKTNKKAAKKMDIYRVPPVLIIHLDRFNSISKNNAKWDTHNKVNISIEYPIDGLDLTSYVLNDDKDSAIYDLYAVINHYDGVNGGKYTVYAKNFMNGSWNCFDNSKVTQVDKKDIVSSAAYILFYQKKFA